MNLLVVRHAPAEDRIRFARSGLPDAERPLTDKGRKKMARTARGLARLVPALGVLATSPYTRALETATILRRAYGGLPLTRLSLLAPGGHREEIVHWLAGLASSNSDGCIAIVGHEPDLGELVGLLVTGSPKPLFELRKGGACLLDCSESLAAGAVRLHWLMRPREMRGIAR